MTDKKSGFNTIPFLQKFLFPRAYIQNILFVFAVGFLLFISQSIGLPSSEGLVFRLVRKFLIPCLLDIVSSFFSLISYRTPVKQKWQLFILPSISSFLWVPFWIISSYLSLSLVIFCLVPLNLLFNILTEFLNWLIAIFIFRSSTWKFDSLYNVLRRFRHPKRIKHLLKH